MKPGARLKTMAELLEIIARTEEPCDRFLSVYFKKHRFIGSKDRKFISEGVYGCLRERIFLDGQVEGFPGRRDLFEKLVLLYVCKSGISPEAVARDCDGSRYHMRALDAQELSYLLKSIESTWKKSLCIPSSLMGPLARSFGQKELIDQEMAALMEKGPVDLRINTLKCTRETVQEALKQKGIKSAPTPFSPLGLRLEKATPLKELELFKEGCFELQDEGSQLTTPLLGVGSDHKVLDYCAGAGGKTLALSALMQNKGQITATDICPQRLQKTIPRLRRAGCANVRVDPLFLEKSPFKEGAFDRVFVDAPCSGSGTWRRHPEALGRTSSETIKSFHNIQKKILKSASMHVRNGGFLLYVTCSIFKEENEDIVAAFVEQNPNWKGVPINTFCDFLPPISTKNPLYMKLSPYETQTDGFFAALLEKKENASQ